MVPSWLGSGIPCVSDPCLPPLMGKLVLLYLVKECGYTLPPGNSQSQDIIIHLKPRVGSNECRWAGGITGLALALSYSDRKASFPREVQYHSQPQTPSLQKSDHGCSHGHDGAPDPLRPVDRFLGLHLWGEGSVSQSLNPDVLLAPGRVKKLDLFHNLN